jgi:hypothetical protein
MNGDYSKEMGAASWLEMLKEEAMKSQAEDEVEDEAELEDEVGEDGS